MSYTIRQANFQSERDSISQIRFDVFIIEQEVPKELEFDERDEFCIHLLGFVDSEPIATCRFDVEEDGKIGRVAVLKNHRRQGIAKAMMLKLHQIAKDNGLTSVWCNAQVTAIPFYESLGYTTTGDPFDEAGIEHRRMTFNLK